MSAYIPSLGFLIQLWTTEGYPEHLTKSFILLLFFHFSKKVSVWYSITCSFQDIPTISHIPRLRPIGWIAIYKDTFGSADAHICCSKKLNDVLICSKINTAFVRFLPDLSCPVPKPVPFTTPVWSWWCHRLSLLRSVSLGLRISVGLDASACASVYLVVMLANN